jgi:hypothetical protein
MISEPSSLNPQPSTLNPHFSSLNPQFQTLNLLIGGEGEEEEGEEAVRWTSMSKRPGGLLQRGVENSREVGEQRHAQDVQTYVSKVKTNPACLSVLSLLKRVWSCQGLESLALTRLLNNGIAQTP